MSGRERGGGDHERRVAGLACGVGGGAAGGDLVVDGGGEFS